MIGVLILLAGAVGVVIGIAAAARFIEEFGGQNRLRASEWHDA